MKDYKIRIEEPGDDISEQFMVRKATLLSGSKVTYSLTKAYPFKPYQNHGTKFYINEVYMKKNSQDLLGLNNDNLLSDKLSLSVRRKANSEKFNVPFIDIYWNTPSFKNEMESISGILMDFIYANPEIDIITPAKIIFPETLDRVAAFDMYLDYLRTQGSVIRDTIGEHRMGFFIPGHFTRDQVRRLLDFYISEYGEDGMVILDMDGKTFNSTSSRVFFALRELKRTHKSDGFSIYAYNLKSRKKSGTAVPSEDLMALYNGISYCGPSHKGLNLPRNVMESLNRVSGKLIFKGDLLYYNYNPEANDEPNIEFLEWIRDNNIEINDLPTVQKKFNSEMTDKIIHSMSESPKEVLDSLSRPLFTDELSRVSKARVKIMRNASINDFF